MPIASARKSAFDVLLRVATEGAYSSVLLAETADALEDRDRALCHEITLGTLRRQMLLDAVIARHSSKPPEKLDREVLIALRMGIYQLEFLDRIPDHAAVNDSVALAVRAGKRSAKGFVNAVLRSAIREPFRPDFDDPVEELSVVGSHPRPLIERWIERFGFTETKALVDFNNTPPPADFRFTARFDRLPEEEREKIREYTDSVSSAGKIAAGSFRAGTSDETLRGLFENGLIYFQDEASQLVADAVGAVPTDSVLDLCAAPGSKTTSVARSIDPERGLIAACELNESRASRLKENCLRQGADFVSVVRADASRGLPFAVGAFDKVLVDAPCTGTGTIARNPEIRYRVSKEDLQILPRKQLTILASASKAVKSGGLLVYSTCSLEQEENEAVADAFLAQAEEFEPAALSAAGRLSDDSGRVNIRPQEQGTSGFFIAAFTRKG
ncbi:MAG: 16S rRNA (cytosine(967)-C(5))-methyltransferase RsmB [Acidobacteriota bacterium]|nr:MAG: 16S rRNA (cytosine(967)-C(5))-methyltransferase RsmB [Acidobacteriota bacterium]